MSKRGKRVRLEFTITGQDDFGGLAPSHDEDQGSGSTEIDSAEQMGSPAIIIDLLARFAELGHITIFTATHFVINDFKLFCSEFMQRKNPESEKSLQEAHLLSPADIEEQLAEHKRRNESTVLENLRKAANVSTDKKEVKIGGRKVIICHCRQWDEAETLTAATRRDPAFVNLFKCHSYPVCFLPPPTSVFNFVPFLELKTSSYDLGIVCTVNPQWPDAATRTLSVHTNRDVASTSSSWYEAQQYHRAGGLYQTPVNMGVSSPNEQEHAFNWPPSEGFDSGGHDMVPFMSDSGYSTTSTDGQPVDPMFVIEPPYETDALPFDDSMAFTGLSYPSRSDA